MVWIILTCLYCDVEPARASGWRAEAVGIDDGVMTWRRERRPQARTFATRRECMRALRRETPERDWHVSGDFGQVSLITHHPDYVEEFQSIPMVQNATINTGCFQVSASNQ